MKFKTSFNFNNIGIKKLTAELVNIDNDITFNILIAHEDDFNNLQDFYDFCIYTLKNKKDLIDMIKKELMFSINEKIMQKHLDNLECNIFDLILDLNKEDIIITIDKS